MVEGSHPQASQVQPQLEQARGSCPSPTHAGTANTQGGRRRLLMRPRASAGMKRLHCILAAVLLRRTKAELKAKGHAFAALPPCKVPPQIVLDRPRKWCDSQLSSPQVKTVLLDFTKGNSVGGALPFWNSEFDPAPQGNLSPVTPARSDRRRGIIPLPAIQSPESFEGVCSFLHTVRVRVAVMFCSKC